MLKSSTPTIEKSITCSRKLELSYWINLCDVSTLSQCDCGFSQTNGEQEYSSNESYYYCSVTNE